MKKALLIAGGGTLGTYTAEELLRLGHSTDIVCLEDKVSDNENLRYYKESATLEFLEKLFAENHYDGIVNFLHFKNYKDYYAKNRRRVTQNERDPEKCSG